MQPLESEKDVESYLCDQAKACGGEAYKFKSPQRANVPDRIVDVPGFELFFVECKSENETPNEGQLREHERLRRLGRKIYVCDTRASVDRIFEAIRLGFLPE